MFEVGTGGINVTHLSPKWNWIKSFFERMRAAFLFLICLIFAYTVSSYPTNRDSIVNNRNELLVKSFALRFYAKQREH